MKAKKSFGQHFLNQPEIARKIADSLALDNGLNRVLEVGPGTGRLTTFLLDKDFDLKVVEADKDMVDYLGVHFLPLQGNIIFKNFLRLDLEAVFEGESFALIGNFPYNISSQILFKMVDNRQLIPEMVGMFQKEVAERVVADPGSKTYGVISVLIQAYYHGKYLFGVDKKCFSPPPKVQSAVIRLERKPQDGLGCDEKLFKSIVKASFGQRRKMLRNSLKPFVKNNEILGSDVFTQRPEQISLEGFIELTNFISENQEAEQ
ncbi:MAG: 16S rRNA (adenine(1518)-N(6)/adenine(1519)-N(6))-dimethyltransferase RsmA [Saprospiraceae bacterium]|nr:16S rRNA (adenine(1518)-N(6)/adenine(1519)-N(6))-dimethyltransferase RsmA [Saprospiraceae bacterium]